MLETLSFLEVEYQELTDVTHIFKKTLPYKCKCYESLVLPPPPFFCAVATLEKEEACAIRLDTIIVTISVIAIVNSNACAARLFRSLSQNIENKTF